jgi:hypothetical protein
MFGALAIGFAHMVKPSSPAKGSPRTARSQRHLRRRRTA